MVLSSSSRACWANRLSCERNQHTQHTSWGRTNPCQRTACHAMHMQPTPSTLGDAEVQKNLEARISMKPRVVPMSQAGKFTAHMAMCTHKPPSAQRGQLPQHSSAAASHCRQQPSLTSPRAHLEHMCHPIGQLAGRQGRQLLRLQLILIHFSHSGACTAQPTASRGPLESTGTLQAARRATDRRLQASDVLCGRMFWAPMRVMAHTQGMCCACRHCTT